jgi:hypothetical protein
VAKKKASKKTAKRPDHLFKPGQSGNPAGRPKGVRDNRSILIDALAEHGTTEQAFAKKIIGLAEEGNATAITVTATRLWKEARATLPVYEFPPEAVTPEEKALAALDAAHRGEISSDHAAAHISAVRGAVELTQISEILERLAALESP